MFSYAQKKTYNCKQSLWMTISCKLDVIGMPLKCRQVLDIKNINYLVRKLKLLNLQPYRDNKLAYLRIENCLTK